MNAAKIAPSLTKCAAVNDQDPVRSIQKIKDSRFHCRRARTCQNGNWTGGLKHVAKTLKYFFCKF